LTIDLGRRLRQPAGAGDQLALQAAAGTDLKHRLVGLADGEFERGGMALALEGIGQRLQPVGRRFGVPNSANTSSNRTLAQTQTSRLTSAQQMSHVLH
jgi:hypothetical protein